MKKALFMVVALIAVMMLACASEGSSGGGGASAGGNVIELSGARARISGNEIRIDQLGRVAYWSSRSDEVKWVGVQIKEEGSYKVTVHAASANGAGMEFKMGDQVIPFEIPNTGAWSADRFIDVGKAALKAGTYEVFLVCTKLTGSYVANIYKVILTKE